MLISSKPFFPLPAIAMAIIYILTQLRMWRIRIELIG
jgi:hypothetical protein